MTNNCYLKNKENLHKEACERYHLSEEEKDKKHPYAHEQYINLSQEEKQKKRQYHCERNKNLSEKQKQEKVEYMKNCN